MLVNGWKAGEPRLCRTDIGAPVFRSGTAAIAGVTSNYTTYAAPRIPVTTHHTRVDALSRFKIGAWLSALGAATVHSCSEGAGGCVKRAFDGGTPPGPAPGGTTEPGGGGLADATAPDAHVEAPLEDASPHADQLPAEEAEEEAPPGETSGSAEDELGDAAAPKKTKKSADGGGCSAAPRTAASRDGVVFGLALVLGAVVARRRRPR